MSVFFDSIKKLLPTSFRTTMQVDSDMSRLFAAISALPDDIKKEIHTVYHDLFPETTRGLADWERAFSLSSLIEGDALRRKVLAAVRQMNNGGQSAFFLQSMLRLVVPEIHVIENIPVQSPRELFERMRAGDSGENQSETQSYCNGVDAVCGNRRMLCGFKTGWILAEHGTPCGARRSVCGNRRMCCNFRATWMPAALTNDDEQPYLEGGSNTWAYDFFVCGGAERNEKGEIEKLEMLRVSPVFKNFIIFFILRIKPVQSRAVVCIQWM